jgi:putative chitinase
MLQKPAAFFDALRAGVLGPVLDSSEVNGVNAILTALEGLPISHVAYGLATAYLETNHTMQPIKELGGSAYFTRMYDKIGQRPDVAKRLGNTEVGDGALFAGRGYVQNTGRKNYTLADEKLSLGGALVRDPDLAMNAEIAAHIMRLGMTEGWFTGRKLSDYLPAAGVVPMAQFVPARAIINGHDRAADVAQAAASFQKALSDGGWQ